MEFCVMHGTHDPSDAGDFALLTDALDRYEREISFLKKGYHQERKRIRSWKSHPMASRFLPEIRSADIAAYRNERTRAGVSANTIRLDLAILSHLFEIARLEWGMESLQNPVRKIRLPPVPEGRDRRLDPGELEKLLNACSVELSMIVRFAIETAMRRGEILSMVWERVDLDKRIVLLSETKNGKRRAVPLTGEAVSVLRTRSESRIDGNKVWRMGPDSVSQSFAKACRKAKIADLRFHDLRHEATSRLFEKGLSTMEVAAITGHKTLQMLMRYTHLKPEALLKRLDSTNSRDERDGI
jgi:integrase